MRSLAAIVLAYVFFTSQVASAFLPGPASVTAPPSFVVSGLQGAQFVKTLNVVQMSQFEPYEDFAKVFGPEVAIPTYSWNQNSMLMAGLKEPVVFSTDYQGFSYRGVAFKWNFKQSTGKNFERFKKTFKQFPELGIPQGSRAGLWVGRAYADVGPIYSAMGIVAGGVILGAAALVVGTVYGVYRLIKASKAEPELRCIPSPKIFVSDEEVVIEPTVKAEVEKNLTAICKSKDGAEKFNRFAKDVKKKLVDGSLTLQQLEASETKIKETSVPHSSTK